MNINRLKLKIIFFFIFVIKSPKNWQKPKKNEILIYDISSIEALLPYLKNYSFTVMALRGELLYVPCFFLAFLTIDFWRGNLLKAYTEIFIQVVSPKVIITFIDNNDRFYELSKRFPNTKTIFIQNGLRSEVGDIFGYLIKSKNYHVDYMFVFGAAIGRKYKTFINGSVEVIGSFKNNLVKKINVKKNDSIVFISQYREKSKDNIIAYQNAIPITYDEFYSFEQIVLKFLAKWCIENNKHLKIAGISGKKEGPETDFYKKILSDFKYELIPRLDMYSPYKLIDTAEIVVFVDSALGYEAIGRGKKVAAFTCKGSVFGKSYNFGWPSKLPDNGPFWTNNLDEKKFKHIMDYIKSLSDKNWNRICQNYTNEIMAFDPGNRRLASVLDQLIL
ncbi:Surface carbohydrate biosynthesis protein, Leptospira [Candidatus Methylopumilus universalis]|uniref:LA_1612 family putative O-antigen biosynthesis protein n=1 Tax=Candidatus Methylopumilus universalis TaxID=2588536 RepID=UPI003BEEED11